MKKTTVVLATLLVAMAVTATTMDTLLDSMEQYDKTQRKHSAILAGKQYVTQFRYRDMNTVVLSNSNLVLMLQGQIIAECGATIDKVTDTHATIDGKKYKLIKKFVYTPKG